MKRAIRFSAVSFAVLTLGCFFSWETSRSYEKRIGLFSSSIQVQFIAFEGDASSRLTAYGRSDPRWHWWRPETYRYRTLEIETFIAGGERLEGVLDVETMILSNESDELHLSTNFISDQLLQTPGATPVYKRKRSTDNPYPEIVAHGEALHEAHLIAVEISRILKTAPTGGLFARRDTRKPLSIYVSRGVWARGFGIEVLFWTPIWFIASVSIWLRRRRSNIR